MIIPSRTLLPDTVTLQVMETSDLRHESRLLKMAAINPTARVVVAGRWEPGFARREQIDDRVEFIRLPMLRGSSYRMLQPLRRWNAGRRLLSLARETRPAIVECHNVINLGWCARIKQRERAALVYAPHELESERNGISPVVRKRDHAIEERNLSACDLVVVVGDEIADWYVSEYGIPRPLVVRNVPELPAEGSPARARSLWRDRFGIPEEAIVLIYQGSLCRGRRIEQLLRVFARVRPDRHLVFMGYGPLEALVKEAAGRQANIHFAPAVPRNEVLCHTAAADVGIVGVENVCLSYYYSLPNKLFEFMLAGIPSLMPDYPEMVRLAGRAGCGWPVGEKDDDWCAAVDGLTAAQIAAGATAARTAATGLSWQIESAPLAEAYMRLLSAR